MFLKELTFGNLAFFHAIYARAIPYLLFILKEKTFFSTEKSVEAYN